MPLVTGGEADEVRDAIFAEGTYHAAYEPQRAIRTPRWKYVRRFGDRRLPVLANIDDSPSKDLWLEHGWPSASRRREQLYDLVFDPNEALQPGRPTRATPGRRAICARASSGGCATRATRCSTARSRRRRAPRSTTRTSSRPASP